MKRVVVALAMGSLLFTTGCGKIREKLAEKAAEKASGQKVNLSSSSGGVSMTDPNTGAVVQSGSAAKIPDGWPSSVPVYPNAKIQSSMTTPNGKTMILIASDPVPTVHSFYKGRLSGLKLVAEVDTGNGKVMSYRDGATTISISMSPDTTGNGAALVTLSATGS